MGITYGDHLIDVGHFDITPEQERELEDVREQDEARDDELTDAFDALDEDAYIENAVIALNARDHVQAVGSADTYAKHDLVAASIAERDLWQPIRAAALKAIEIRLQEDISREERAVLREIEFQIIHGRSEA